MASSGYFDNFFSDIDRLKLNEGNILGKFFFVFSRFEFALKATGYFTKDGKTLPDWQRFTTEVKEKYVPGMNESVDSAIEYLCERPVERQMSSGKTFAFEPISRRQQTGDLEFSLQSVVQIRNNLFHGGKFPSGPVTDPGRDAQLLCSGLVVLAQCLEWNSKMREKFFEVEK